MRGGSGKMSAKVGIFIHTSLVFVKKLDGSLESNVIKQNLAMVLLSKNWKLTLNQNNFGWTSN